METPLTVVILAAGLGTRMKSRKAKVLHRAGGQIPDRARAAHRAGTGAARADFRGGGASVRRGARGHSERPASASSSSPNKRVLATR